MNGLRGRPPKPKTSPGAKSRRPKVPSHLPPLAKQVWRSLVPELEAMGVLNQVSSTVIERYCLAYSNYREAEDSIREDGLLIPGTHGTMKSNPSIRASAIFQGIMKEIEDRFGFHPVARARLGIDDNLLRKKETQKERLASIRERAAREVEEERLRRVK